MITREEYDLLNKYRAKGYSWIARDRGDECVYAYKSKPIKLDFSWGTEHGCYQLFVNDDSLPFIKWEDEKPTQILDLIQDYESHQIITGENTLNDFFGTDNFNIKYVPQFKDLLSSLKKDVEYLENKSSFEHRSKQEETNMNKAELIKEIEGILDDIGVDDYQLGESRENESWIIPSRIIRKILSAIEKHSPEKEKQYILKFSNGQYLYSCDLGTTDEELACKLTRAEIEAVDPRLMQFAEEVE